MFGNMSNNGTDDQATIFDDDTLSTSFEENESLSIKQMISKDKRKLSDIIEAGTTSTSQKNKSTPKKNKKYVMLMILFKHSPYQKQSNQVYLIDLKGMNIQI